MDWQGARCRELKKENILSEQLEPELITIVEGPTPNFQLDAAPWALSVLEGQSGYIVAH